MEYLVEKLKRELEIRNSSKQTIEGYLYSVKRFLQFSNGVLDEDSVKDYIQKELNEKSPSSVRKDLFAIKFFFNAVLKQKLNLPNPKRNHPLPEILTIEEIKAMLDKTSNIKHRLILKLLYGCGLRVSEIVDLKKQNINFEEDLIHIRLSKGRKDRFVKIPSSAKEELQDYIKINRSDILFPSNRSGKLSKDTIQKIVQNSAKKAGIKKRVYPHLLRHSFAAHLLEQGINLKIIQKLLGHSDIKTTQIYTHVANSDIKNIKSPLDYI